MEDNMTLYLMGQVLIILCGIFVVGVGLSIVFKIGAWFVTNVLGK